MKQETNNKRMLFSQLINNPELVEVQEEFYLNGIPAEKASSTRYRLDPTTTSQYDLFWSLKRMGEKHGIIIELS